MIWLVSSLIRFYILLVLLRVAASWLDPHRTSEYSRLLALVTEPVLAPFRRVFYLRGMSFDFSPLVALICLEILRGLIVLLLRVIGFS